jgi:HK97 family phage major capsid protein
VACIRAVRCWVGPFLFAPSYNGEPIPIAHAGPNFRNTLAASLPDRGEGNEQIGIADFLRGIAGMKTSPGIRAALSEGTDSAGGYGLPAFSQLNLLEALAPVSSLMTAGAGVSMITNGAKSYRAARGSTIPTAAWRAESGTVATSDPAFSPMDIVPRLLSVQFKISRELLADGANLDVSLYDVLAQSFAKEFDRAGLRGSGTAPEPRGILNTSTFKP